MQIIKSLASIILARVSSVLGFFLLAAAMDAENFSRYAFYFSFWQISSQAIGLQIGVTLFRVGNTIEHSISARSIFTLLKKVSGVATLTFMIALSADNVYLSAILMALIFSTFYAISEYARSQISEASIYAIHALPGLLYITIFISSWCTGTNYSFIEIITIEALSYFLGFLLIIRFLPQETSKNSCTSTALRNIYPAWKQISLPLIPNNLIWYIYFNLPQVLLHFAETDPEKYRTQALVFRTILALATVTSNLSLPFQKKVVSIFEENQHQYQNLKKNITLRLLPTSLPLICAAGGIYSLIVSNLRTAPLNPDLLEITKEIYIQLSLITWLFFSIFTFGHFLLAEKNSKIAAKTMLAGFPFYCGVFFSANLLGLSIELSAIYALITALLVTLTLRYSLN